MNKKRLLIIIASAAVIIIAITLIIGLQKPKEDAVDFENLSPAEQAQELNKHEESFYGTWSATSAKAEHLYGNLDLTINEDGTFDGNVFQMDFKGTWEKIDEGISLDSDFIEGALYFGEKCRLVIREDLYDGSSLRVTMTKMD